MISPGIRRAECVPEAVGDRTLRQPDRNPDPEAGCALSGKSGARPAFRRREDGNGDRFCFRYHPSMLTVYEAADGDVGLFRLARAWHTRVMADEVVSHAFSHGFHPEHSERLAAYWAEALGGPATYSAAYGDETSVLRMHSGNGGPHEEMDRRAIACFDQALVDVGLADDDRVRQVLHDYFAWATTTTMNRYHRSADDVPDGLHLPHWSWDGIVS
jgi:hemoglobin